MGQSYKGFDTSELKDNTANKEDGVWYDKDGKRHKDVKIKAPVLGIKAR